MSIQFNPGNLIAGLEAQKARVDAATEVAAFEAGHVIEAGMKARITGGHPKGTKTGASPGGPPQNISGSLRRSITTEHPTHLGTGMYEVTVGPTIVYGRAVDLGGAHHWPAGVSYPYVQSGANQAISSGAVEAVFLSSWAKAIAL